MLALLQSSLARLLYEQGRIDPFDVDIRFDAPTPAWTDRLTRPTIDLFLYDLAENANLRQTAFNMTRSSTQSERRLAVRRINLHYLVSAIAADPADEGLLLWQVLGTILRTPEMPAELVPEEIQQLEATVLLKLADDDERISGHDLWSGLGNRPRPALRLIVTAPLDPEISYTAPLVLTRSVRIVREGSVDQFLRIGGFVHDRKGAPITGATVALADGAETSITDENGVFRLRVPEGEVRLLVNRPDGMPQSVTITVPSPSYVVTLR